jgi:Pin2-interacting protein X1
MAASNSTALAEILGIPSSSTSSSAHPSAVASPLPDPALAFATTATSNATAATTSEAKDLLQNLTTSSQSVGDYFKAKLDAKAHGARPTSAAASVSTRDDDHDDRRAGLGSGLGFGARPLRITPPDGLDGEPARGGIGASSLSMFATMFIPHQSTTNAREENTATTDVEIVVSHRDASHYDDNREKSEKMRAKEERRRRKEERRRKRTEAEAGQVDRVAVDGACAAKSKQKQTPDGRLEDLHPSGADGREAIATKKRKDKKSSKHRGLEE